MISESATSKFIIFANHRWKLFETFDMKNKQADKGILHIKVKLKIFKNN